MAFDWAALPLDILGTIALKLETFKDFITFSVVCRCWNHASSLLKHQWRATPSVPWLLLVENTSNKPSCVRKIQKQISCYRLNFPKTFGERCWGSPYGWVAVAKRDLTIQLFNPITKANISFPSLETIADLHKYNPEDFKDYYDWVLRTFLKKLVVLRVSQSGHHEFVIILLSDFSKGLAFAKHGDKSWTTILIKETGVTVYDVVAMDDHVFALYDDGAIAYWSVDEFYGLNKIVKPMNYYAGEHGIFERFDVNKRRIYLVQSSSDLLMVLVLHEEYVQAYRLNPQDKVWEEIKDLGDVALFLGDNSSMSVSRAHLKCLRSNFIYFTDQESPFWLMVVQLDLHFNSHFHIIYNRIFYKDDDIRSSLCTPTWFIPQF
ncbi:F-box protein At2g17036-like [Silene latifolia]|uniref:F-box protein At2g17036-like n=1 Tax=Silene latifolia TaxID=37657 RepID=UPI003D78204D